MSKEIEIKNAVIKSAYISNDNHGILDAGLSLDYGGTCQHFGGYALYIPKGFKHHSLQSVAGHFIWRIMEIAGVGEWSELVGKTIRVKASWSAVYAVGHIVKNDWFCPEKDFSKLIAENEEEA